MAEDSDHLMIIEGFMAWLKAKHWQASLIVESSTELGIDYLDYKAPGLDWDRLLIQRQEEIRNARVRMMSDRLRGDE